MWLLTSTWGSPARTDAELLLPTRWSITYVHPCPCWRLDGGMRFDFQVYRFGYPHLVYSLGYPHLVHRLGYPHVAYRFDYPHLFIVFLSVLVSGEGWVLPSLKTSFLMESAVFCIGAALFRCMPCMLIIAVYAWFLNRVFWSVRVTFIIFWKDFVDSAGAFIFWVDCSYHGRLGIYRA